MPLTIYSSADIGPMSCELKCNDRWEPRVQWTDCYLHECMHIGIYTYVCYIYLCNGGRDPYCTGGVRRRCHIYIYLEEGTRIARAECEDGAIYTYIWRKGPVWYGRSAKTVLYTYVRRKGPVWHGRSAKTVLYTYSCIFTNDWEWMAMSDIYVCVTLGVCWICYCIW